MAAGAVFDKTVLMLDGFSQDDQQLYEDFQAAGIDCPVVHLRPNGFLPDGILSPHDYYAGGKGPFRPRRFSEAIVPETWISEQGSAAVALEAFGIPRGKIGYAKPVYQHTVGTVELYDKDGKPCAVDYYRSDGVRYARSVCRDGMTHGTFYFDNDGRVFLTEQFPTGHLLMEHQGRTEFFRSRVELCVKFLQDLGLTGRHIVYRSTGFARQVIEALGTGGHILFYNGTGKDIKDILAHKCSHTKMVVARDRATDSALKSLGWTGTLQGPVYTFTPPPPVSRSVLIYTSTDVIPWLDGLSSELPDIHFHVAAPTQVSAKLARMGERQNITVYPLVQHHAVQYLMGQCSVMLDITKDRSHMTLFEYLREAFLRNILILAAKDTRHVPYFATGSAVLDTMDDMADMLRDVTVNPAALTHMLERQRAAASPGNAVRLRSMLMLAGRTG